MADEGFRSHLKRLLVGEPIPSHLAHHERFSRVTGLAVLSSDALSSVAYATEEILRVLILVGVGGACASSTSHRRRHRVAFSRLSCSRTARRSHAYPSGGGAYIVAKENLGEMPSLVAAAALLIDYVLTVAVSIAAGVAALTSAFPAAARQLASSSRSGFVAILTLGNLRGIRESGDIFAAADLLLHRQHPGAPRRSGRGAR